MSRIATATTVHLVMTCRPTVAKFAADPKWQPVEEEPEHEVDPAVYVALGRQTGVFDYAKTIAGRMRILRHRLRLHRQHRRMR